jgi:CBS domain-containing protein
VGEGIASGNDPVSVESIMKKNPVQVSPDTDTIHAIQLMRESRVGCLPVVMDQKLVGLITEADLIEVSAMLLEEQLREP